MIAANDKRLINSPEELQAFYDAWVDRLEQLLGWTFIQRVPDSYPCMVVWHEEDRNGSAALVYQFIYPFGTEDPNLVALTHELIELKHELSYEIGKRKSLERLLETRNQQLEAEHAINIANQQQNDRLNKRLGQIEKENIALRQDIQALGGRCDDFPNYFED